MAVSDESEHLEKFSKKPVQVNAVHETVEKPKEQKKAILFDELLEIKAQINQINQLVLRGSETRGPGNYQSKSHAYRRSVGSQGRQNYRCSKCTQNNVEKWFWGASKG